jgi:hypothetical protein
MRLFGVALPARAVSRCTWGSDLLRRVCRAAALVRLAMERATNIAWKARPARPAAPRTPCRSSTGHQHMSSSRLPAATSSCWADARSASTHRTECARTAVTNGRPASFRAASGGDSETPDPWRPLARRLERAGPDARVRASGVACCTATAGPAGKGPPGVRGLEGGRWAIATTVGRRVARPRRLMEGTLAPRMSRARAAAPTPSVGRPSSTCRERLQRRPRIRLPEEL